MNAFSTNSSSKKSRLMRIVGVEDWKSTTFFNQLCALNQPSTKNDLLPKIHSRKFIEGTSFAYLLQLSKGNR